MDVDRLSGAFFRARQTQKEDPDASTVTRCGPCASPWRPHLRRLHRHRPHRRRRLRRETQGRPAPDLEGLHPQAGRPRRRAAARRPAVRRALLGPGPGARGRVRRSLREGARRAAGRGAPARPRAGASRRGKRQEAPGRAPRLRPGVRLPEAEGGGGTHPGAQRPDLDPDRRRRRLHRYHQDRHLDQLGSAAAHGGLRPQRGPDRRHRPTVEQGVQGRRPRTSDRTCACRSRRSRPSSGSGRAATPRRAS